MKETKLISKSAFARELGITPARITQLIAKGAGMPVRKDGKIDRQAALEWLKMRASSHGGGWGVRDGGRNIAGRAAELLSAKPSKPTHRKRSVVQPAHTPEFAEQLRIADALTSAEAQTEFFRACMKRFGLSEQQAYDVTNWFGFVVLCGIEDVVDMAGEPDWVALLGVDKVRAFEEAHDLAIAPEIIHAPVM